MNEKKYCTYRLAHNDIEFILCEIRARIIKKKIIRSLESKEEFCDVANYLNNHTVTVFPYNFTQRYITENVKVCKDNKSGLLYTNYNGKKIFLKRKYKSIFRAARYMKNIYLEQDEESPHRYLAPDFYPPDDCVVFDVGGAEGIFALSVIDRVKKVYIFEPDEGWSEALLHTFESYKDKVNLISKFVSGCDEEKRISLDKFIKDNSLEKEKLFIKIDAEGSEIDILKGLSDSINRKKDLMICVCAYHCGSHENDIKELFTDWNITTSSGYMLYYYDFYFSVPFLRRGVLRVRR